MTKCFWLYARPEVDNLISKDGSFFSTLSWDPLITFAWTEKHHESLAICHFWRNNAFGGKVSTSKIRLTLTFHWSYSNTKQYNIYHLSWRTPRKKNKEQTIAITSVFVKINDYYKNAKVSDCGTRYHMKHYWSGKTYFPPLTMICQLICISVIAWLTEYFKIYVLSASLQLLYFPLSSSAYCC